MTVVSAGTKLSGTPVPASSASSPTSIEALSTGEHLRRVRGISIEQLAVAANISVTWYRTIIRNPDLASPALVKRLAVALRSLSAAPRKIEPDALVTATYGGFLVAICPFYGVRPAEVRAADPQRGATASTHWRTCSHARQAAIYLTHTALAVTQRTLAGALNLTPAAVCLALQSVEDRRDDPDFSAALEAAHRDVMGAAT